MNEPGRRDVMRGMLMLVGATAAMGIAPEAVFAAPESLPAEQMQLLTAVADTIIPQTDTPGAAAAGVPAMLDKLLANWASPAQRTRLLGALDAIDQAAHAKTGMAFAALTPERRYEVLSAFDAKMVKDPGYARLRQLVATTYYLSEAGATIELRYEHAPGAWEPSIPVTADTRNYGGPDRS